MATITLSLSGKKDKVSNLCEIYLCLSVDRNHVFRAKTGLHVGKSSWNKDKQKVIIPRMKIIESMTLTKLQAEIDVLCNGIKSAVLSTPVEVINKTWLESLIMSLTGKVQNVQKCEDRNSFQE